MAVRLRSRGGQGKPRADSACEASLCHTLPHACIPLFVNLIVLHRSQTALITVLCVRACWTRICMAGQWWFRAA